MTVASGSPAAWTTVADLRAVLERRWRTGRWLTARSAGEPWQPVSLPVRGPKAYQLLDRLDEVRTWMSRLSRDCAATARRPGLRIETKIVKSRRVGANELPVRVWVDSFDDLIGFLGVGAEVARFDRLLQLSEVADTGARDWAVAHPRSVLENATIWPLLLDCVRWIRDHPTPELYLRQVDVPGIDTKFMESTAPILSSLLDVVLPEERIDLRFGRSDLVGRYGFRRRPDYTRARFLAPQTVLPAGLSELVFRTEELTKLDPQLGEVVIVENEISFLALPDRPDTLAIFGSGFALGSVAGLSWLQNKKIIYWGDLDTYGLVILNRLRARYPHVHSILMDVDTLLAHRTQWVREEVPTRIALPHLDETESELYQALVEDRFGSQVRLEQERIRFSIVRAALAAVQ
jgi:hypothetical protein